MYLFDVVLNLSFKLRMSCVHNFCSIEKVQLHALQLPKGLQNNCICRSLIAILFFIIIPNKLKSLYTI